MTYHQQELNLILRMEQEWLALEGNSHPIRTIKIITKIKLTSIPMQTRILALMLKCLKDSIFKTNVILKVCTNFCYLAIPHGYPNEQ